MKNIVKTLTKRSDDYSQWYQDVIANADLAEHSVVRGCMVIKPYGYAIWEKIVAVVDSMLKEMGVKNAYFPIFIPQSFLEREKKHIKGLSPELAVVTHGGGKELEEPLVVRPTSETIIYESFSRWIQSYRDLPFVINQWANVVRWEMRPRLFLRTSEFLWQEGHSAHISLREAEEYALKILNEVYAKFVQDYLAMPVYTGQKSDSEKFAGALKTFCIEALMQDGKSLQAGTSHNLSDNFSKPFNVAFLDKDGQRKNVFQTSWGVSTRLIGGLIMTHSDDKGLVLPPRIAPVQVVIIPIAKANDEKIFSTAKSVANQLVGFSVEIDSRNNLRPGEKYYEWEKKGVPVRMEIGPKDLGKNTVVLVRRDTGVKETCLISQVQKRVDEILQDIQSNLFSTAMKRREESNKTADSWQEFEKALKQGGYVFSYFCGDEDCETEIKAKTKAVSRFLPLNAKEEEGDHYCIHCGKKTLHKKRWAFALAY
ncbi:MAG: Proline-tRNA ligase [Candidatus Curtissbacteria bacterium GW2011_GWA1_40_24]|uniref:Proline--tRNA ligase n=2 Tax=Patescibacteria group TaxID=1783273 RepID=A0A0G0RT31_9BACT|nr:MAG: Proline-tRNA ligase [Candidatus Curtissbacteria bacterium GW2011_GWA1_40_24]KKR89018.1 MAG: Proline-tRNA ligase [Candidatus Wolfebacteria bacterium GW2011_GWB1_41_12]